MIIGLSSSVLKITCPRLKYTRWNILIYLAHLLKRLTLLQRFSTYLNSQAGIIKNAAKVDIAVMVMDRSRFPPNITVQILEAPPPGEHPVTNKPSLIGAYVEAFWPRSSAAGKMNPKPNAISGMNMYWQINPIIGPIGFFNVSFTTWRSIAHPIFM